MNWFEYAILKGKIAAQKAKTLTDDWITLELSDTSNSPTEYMHQGLPAGVYCAQVEEAYYSAVRLYVVSTGGYSAEVQGAKFTLSTSRITYNHDGYKKPFRVKVKQIL